MAKVGKSEADPRMTDPHGELLVGISEHANQVYGRVLLDKGIVDPMPRDFVAAGLELKMARAKNGLPELPRDVVIGTFLWLVPAFER